MHELMEGVPNVKVAEDDFVVIGHGSTEQQEALQDHDKNVTVFLQVCEDQ